MCNPGLAGPLPSDAGVPQAIDKLFHIVDRDDGKYATNISCYMLELYQDDLTDLLLPDGWRCLSASLHGKVCVRFQLASC